MSQSQRGIVTSASTSRSDAARLPRRHQPIASRSFVNGYRIRRARARNRRTQRTRNSGSNCRVLALARAIPSTWNQLATYRKATRRIELSASDGS